MDRQDIQTRRAENQVWNGSGAYDTKPELLVFDGGGDADLYGNTVLGLAGRYYRFDLFRPLLNDFHRSVQEGLYTDVFFLVLEGAVFRRGAQERPILPDLRAAYARTLLRDTPPAARISAGMRSSAMTAQAPAASAILACSGVVTSIMTPPLSIWQNCLFSSTRLFSRQIGPFWGRAAATGGRDPYNL